MPSADASRWGTSLRASPPPRLAAALDRGWRRRLAPVVEDGVELGVLAHPIAVAADVDDVAVVKEAVDEGGGHDVITEDLAPLLEALVGLVRTVEACS